MIYDTLNINNYKGNELFEYYDKEYDKYYLDLGIKGAKEKADVVASFVDKSFDSIVDLGCGTGIFLRELSKQLNTNRSVGTDISMFILQEAQKQCPLYDFYRSDSENLPFKNKEFDVSTIIDVLEHVPNPEKLIDEAARVSNYIIFRVPLEDVWFINLYKKFIKVDWKQTLGHINFYNLKSIKKVMEEHNLELVKYIIPKIKLYPDLNWKMTLMNWGQWLTNILPEWLRTKIFPTEFYALYKVK